MIKTCLAASLFAILGTEFCHAQSRPITPAERVLITSTYGAQLKDAPSALYKMPPIPSADPSQGGGHTYCFEVNAKNSYGGFTGYKVIIGKVIRSAGKVTSFTYLGSSDDDARSLPGATADMCRALGAAIS
jgi:hypothetical protein